MRHASITLEPHARIDPRARPVVLSARSLVKSFGGTAVLRGASVDLRAGEVVLLRGPNGSGKTTLLNLLSGNLEPDSGEILYSLNGSRTSFRFPVPWWQRINLADPYSPERVARLGLARTWQDMRLFDTQSLRDNIAVAASRQPGENPLTAVLRPVLARRHEVENACRATEILASLGLAGREESSADRISIGQAKRVAIARAVHGGARALFLDEPLAGLDEQGIETVLDLLRQLASSAGVAVLLVEHVVHIPTLLPCVDTVWTLTEGRVIASEAGVIAQEHSALGECDKCLTFSGNQTVRELRLPGEACLSITGRHERSPGEPVLQVENLVVHRGRRQVLGSDKAGAPLSFTLCAGELALLRAPNGWGKTTLLEAISGLLPIRSGSIRLRGEEISSSSPWQRRERGVTLMRARQATFDNLSVAESLGLARAEGEAAVLPFPWRRRVGDLSGGEKQRLALVCSTADPNAKLRLFDEPFAMLDPVGISEVQSRLDASPWAATLVAEPGLAGSGLPMLTAARELGR